MTVETPSPNPPSDDRAKEILRSRARELARPPIAPGDDSGLVVIEFRLAKERYAIEQTYVREVCRLSDLTPLPGVPSFFVGIINVRGQILSVVDVKKFFDLPDEGMTDLHSVIIVRSGEIELGIVADVVVGIRSISAATLQASLPTLTGIRADYLKGVTDEHIVVLDVAKILSDSKIAVNEEVGN